MSRTALIVLIVAVLALAVVAFFVIRRQRYVRALRRRGWTFQSRPTLDWVLDHHAPPFGLGFVRKVDEGISGTTASGVDFRVFEYACREGGEPFDERLASLRLPLPLPDLFIHPTGRRTGLRVPNVDNETGLLVAAEDAGYARLALGRGLAAAVAGFAHAGHSPDVSIDGQNLVAVGAPKDPDELQAYLEALAAVALAVDAAALAPYAQPPLPPRFGFYGRPDWVLVGRDDSLIARYDLTRAGFGHETVKVVHGDNGGLPVDGFIHRWKTQRTETYTDSEGRTQTRTVTDEHSEVICAVRMPFAWPMLSVGGGWGGERVKFESEEFNDRFTVRTADAKFAYDVLHPRTMEFLMHEQPPGFRIDHDVMRFSVNKHDSEAIGRCADFAHAFFGRVPSFVWKNLQVTPPEFRGAE